MKQKQPARKIIGEAEVRLKDRTVKLPVHQGSESECGIDIGELRSQTSCITLDPGFGNTGSCTSAITFIDGDKGDMFFHHSAVEETTIEQLQVGQRVTYDEGRGPKGPRAENVKPA